MGAWPLEYQRFSSTLRAVGDVEITCRRFPSLPRTVGRWSCEISRFGGRLECIGPYELIHDRAGRVCAVGPLEIIYDRVGSHPVRVRRPGEESLSDELLLVLFLVLFWQQQAWDAYDQASR